MMVAIATDDPGPETDRYLAGLERKAGKRRERFGLVARGMFLAVHDAS